MHETAASIFYATCWFAFAAVLVSLVLTAVRLRRGPHLMDRVLALDLLVTLGIGLIAATSALTGAYAYIDVAVALALVGFLGTVAFAMYALSRARLTHTDTDAPN